MLRTRKRLGILLAAAAALLAGPATASAGITARYDESVTLMSDGSMLVIGGMTGGAGTQLQTVEVYISTGAKIEARAPLTVARASHTATLLPDGRVLVAGGVSSFANVTHCNGTGGTVCSIGALYNPVTDTWADTTNAMSAPRFNHTATLLPTGQVLIVGGQSDTAGNLAGDGTPPTTATCDIFDPATNSFLSCPSPLQMARAGHTATLLNNGHVFVAGGYRAPGNGISPTTEIYDPIAKIWSAGPPLIDGRAYHTATQMGNQQVLIAGGYNGLNVRENQGILDTTEIYDPNSNTIVPGAPMEARKMFHTDNLTGAGNVDVYGGLGNITTSYYTTGLTFNSPSSLDVTESGSSWLQANITANVSPLSITPDIKLSAGVTGLVVDGLINFSSPTVQLTDAKVLFNYPDQTEGSLDGLSTVNPGEIDSTLNITKNSGVVSFTPQKVSSKDMLLTAGLLHTVGDATITPGVTFTLAANTTLSGTIIVPMPSSDVNGTVLAGAAIITGGSISLASSDATQGYDVKLTSGLANIAGGTVVNDPTNGPQLSMAVTFTGIAGTIASSTSTNRSSPVNATGQSVTSLTLQLNYIVSPITLSNAAFSFDIATVTIRNMIFADQEIYNPGKNTWSFGTPGFATFNHSETLLPNSDEVIYGGLTCTSVANCTNKVFAAQSGPEAYILLQQNATPWTGVGDLNTARSNHTLTPLPDGRVLAAGGENATDALTSSELFDPSARTWTKTADMKQKRSHHTAALLPNGTVLAAGGFTTLSQSTGTTNASEIYYPAAGAWVQTAPMVSSRAYHAMVPLPNGDVFVMGGFTNGQYLSSTEVFISTALTWLAGPPIGGGVPEPRAHFTATTLRDGRIIVIGGINAANGVLATSKIFDPGSWTWSNGPNLSFARYSHTATLLRDGRVLVVGGDNGSGEIAHAEIYDPTVGVNGKFFRVREDLGGNDLSIPRLRHTATLLPDGKVLIVGGFTAFGGPVQNAEGFDVDFSTFQMQGLTSVARGDQATVLMKDGFLLNAGGFDGLSYRPTSEIMYFSAFPDATTLAGGQARRPLITQVQPSSLFLPGSLVTAVGSNFRGVSEASGGGAASANSSHAHPRVYLQRVAGTMAATGDSGWMVDLTSGMFNSGLNSWSKMDSSLTFTVPYTNATLPLGWYHLRVAANDQFSQSALVQVAPPRPTAVPGMPAGVAVGPSSVTWTWAPAAGSAFDGYSIYSATSGIFISTLSATVGPCAPNICFLQTGLGPDTSSLIEVAAYNIGGDGPVVLATQPVVTAVSGINGLQGVAQSPQSIFWSWGPVDGANSYEVFSASNSQPLSSVSVATFTQTALTTNTAYGIRVQAILPGGPGFLSAASTAYTWAAPPVADFPPVVNVTTGSLTAQWLANTNPGGTQYELEIIVNNSSPALHVSSIVALTYTLFGGTPNTQYSLSVAAENGDGVFTGFAQLGSTFTLADPPLNAVATGGGPSSISVSWNANGNPTNTRYKILYSYDNFTTNVSTFADFSLDYTTPSATISSLLTETTYTFRISAANGFGHETAATSVQGFTNNGGGPPGSLAFTASATNYSALDGTLSSTTVTRRFTMSVPANAFTADTQIFVSTLSTFHQQCSGPGGLIPVGVSIINSPGLQPTKPLEIAIRYYPVGDPQLPAGDPNLGPLATLSMVRFDPISGHCVPLVTTIDTANNLVHAQINHLSDYQLMQIVPQATSDLGISRIFPNPFYASRQSYVTFDRLPANARIRVYTLHGEELVDLPTNASGIATWNGTNKAGRSAASGIYLAVVQSGGEKKIMKLVIVR